MGWLAVSLLADAAHAEQFADALTAAGALSATIEDADAGTVDEEAQFGEPGSETRIGWRRSQLEILCTEDCDVARLVATAAAAAGIVPAPGYRCTAVADQDWVRLTQSQFDPIRVTERLWIVPSWHTAPDPHALNIALDPGLAFGTGSHPTTRLCLAWLEREVKPGCTVLDVGCGSGILAIAAAKLGAAAVDATDIDPQALLAAGDNARNNGVTLRIEDAAKFRPGEYDLVVANILANPLKTLAPALCGHVRRGGSLALAGLLDTQAAELIEIYAPWLALHAVASEGGWTCLAGRRTEGGR